MYFSFSLFPKWKCVLVKSSNWLGWFWNILHCIWAIFSHDRLIFIGTLI
jgi:hypothetical protein